MKGIAPTDDYFEIQKKAAIEFKERAASGKAGMPCVGDDNFDYSSDQTMWDTLGDLEEKEAQARAFGGGVGAPVITARNI